MAPVQTLSDAATAHLQRLGVKEGECCVFKQFDVVAEPIDDRRIRFTVTTNTPDREGDILETGGIDTAAYEHNSIVMYAHDYKQLPIGRAVAIERFPNRLVATVEFAPADMNPFAEQVYRLVKAGFLKACSIGFRPVEWEYDEVRGGVNFLKTEMLEFSICPIPANAEALVAARAAGIDKDWADRTLQGLATIQDEPVALSDRDPFLFVDTTPAGAGNRTYARRGDPVRWNQQLTKTFDVTTQEFPARSIEQDLAAKYCGCQVKDLYHRHEPVYSTRLGAFLCALDEVLRPMLVEDVRNLGADGREEPPLYEHIQLNSTRSEEFIVDGLRFMQWNGVRLALRVEPRWYGVQVTAYAERKHADAARALFEHTIAKAKEFNFLKGEAFSLSGEFLTRGSERLMDVFLDAKNQKLAERLLQLVNENGAQLENRGVIMLGPPGNGKTLLGRILMNQAKATFIWASARDFYYSGGFRGLAAAFEVARESSAAGTPAIIFIEDVDNYLDGHTTDLMKTEMDGIAQSRGVVTILTTNYPEHLPKALIDRPGRFHDVLRFDLPDAAVRRQMLARWLPALAGAALESTVKALHGYSGAHVREFARFAGIIGEQDGVDVIAASRAALEKLQEQRDLITSVQSQGSRYRAPEHVQQAAHLAATEDLLETATFATEPSGPFAADVVGWKAFVRARDRALRRDAILADDVLVSMLSDYGFEAEAAMITAARTQPDMTEPGAAVTKRGRVISRANETKLQNAQSSALACSEQIKEVLATVAAQEDPDDMDDSPAGAALSVLDLVSDNDLFVLDLEPEPDLIEIDGAMLREAIGEAMVSSVGAMVASETRRAINAARGRLDDEST